MAIMVVGIAAVIATVVIMDATVQNNSPHLSTTHYNKTSNFVEWYRNADLNILESMHRDAVILAHDFETKFHPDNKSDGSTLVVALLAQKYRLLGAYEATEQEEKLHDWAIKLHNPPSTIAEIDRALLEIVGTEENFEYAEEVYHMLTFSANHGSVPISLYQEDSEYWGIQNHLAMCEYLWAECDLDKMQDSISNNRELTEAEMAQLLEDVEQDSKTVGIIG